MTNDPSKRDGPVEFPTPEDLPDEPMTPADLSPFSVDGDDFTDINDFATAEWKASTTADERIRAVIKRTTSPKPVKEIAAIASVSENKARDTLNTLVKDGSVRSYESDSGKTYERDPDWYLLRQVHQLATSGGLVNQIQRTKRELVNYHEQYETSEPEEVLISDRELTQEELEDISHWRTAKREFNYLRAAYHLRQAKDEATHGRKKSTSQVPDQQLLQ